MCYQWTPAFNPFSEEGSHSDSNILSSCADKFHNPVINAFQGFFLKLSGVWCKNIGVWAEQRSQHLQQSKTVPIFSDLGGRSRDTLLGLLTAVQAGFTAILIQMAAHVSWVLLKTACIIATAKLELNQK